MKRFYFYIILASVLCLTLATCKHKPEIDPEATDCGEATTIDEMMEWVYFKTGTYWIYEEQNTGTLDTMTVYYDYNGVSSTGNREFVVKMRSSLDGYTYEYWFNDAWSTESTLNPGCILHAVDCEKYIPGDFVGGNHTFIFPLKIGNRAYQLGPNLATGYTEIIEKHDSVSLSSVTFQNVCKFKLDFSIQHNRKLANYAICYNIGIIQKEIPELNENWFLIEYQIIQ